MNRCAAPLAGALNCWMLDRLACRLALLFDPSTWYCNWCSLVSCHPLSCLSPKLLLLSCTMPHAVLCVSLTLVLHVNQI